MQENVIEWYQRDATATVQVANASWLKNRLEKLLSLRDDIKKVYENKDGSALYEVPVSWVKVSPPKQMSEKQREQAAERMRLLREKKKVED